MNFQQWQASIKDIKARAGTKFQQEISYKLNQNEFSFTLEETGDTFTAKLNVTHQELEEVKKFVEESNQIFKQHQTFKEVNSVTSKMEP